MSRTNQTQFAVLGLLSLKAMSGYDIKKTIEKSIQHFWSESYGNLYPCLEQLLKKNFVKVENQSNTKRQRKEYKITASGKEYLAKWLEKPLTEPSVRDELLLKLFFGKNVANKKLLSHISNEIQRVSKELTELKEIQEELLTKHENNPNLPFWLITLNCGKKELNARLSWCNQTYELLTRKK